MEELHNQTLAYNYNEPTSVDHFRTIALIVHCLISSVAVPLICFAIYGLHSLVKTNHVAPVFVINLFISDLIQVSATVILSVIRKMRLPGFEVDVIVMLIYMFGVGLNICFMVCLFADRYTMIAHPVWYRNMLTMRTSVFVSVAVWILFVLLTMTGIYYYKYLFVVALVILLLPYPLLLSFFVLTWRALSRTSVPHNDQRQIKATLGLVLCVYTILFLPYTVILSIFKYSSVHFDLASIIKWLISSELLIALNPLFDVLLYVFMRKDAKDIFSALRSCFYKRHEEDTVTTNVTEDQV